MKATNDPYFDWLCILVGMDGRGDKGYFEMVRALHEREFKPKLRMDANRGDDGLRLRVEFLHDHGPFGTATNRGAATMLEFLIGLARRMSFLMHGEGSDSHTENYFWKMIGNLGLLKATDDNWYEINGDFFVEDACYRVNERMYNRDGSGGLFPLRNASRDQRGVEIWYQMQSWLLENSDIGEL